MKISTEINSARRIIGEEKAVELYAKAGFDAWDFSMFNMFTFAWNTRKAIVPDRSPDRRSSAGHSRPCPLPRAPGDREM